MRAYVFLHSHFWMRWCTLQDAKGLLVNITGGSDLTLFEVDEAGERVTKVRPLTCQISSSNRLLPESAFSNLLLTYVSTSPIQELEDPHANIIFGSSFDESLNGKIRVSIVATGIADPDKK